MSFPNIIHLSEEETFNTYTAERYPVGSKAVVEDGRIFRFALELAPEIFRLLEDIDGLLPQDAD